MVLDSRSRLGPYEITGVIDSGGMGEVYRARDTRLGRDVAVKVLPAEFADHPERVRRFEQEARAVAALNHPNILTLHDIGTQDGSPYLVTELLEGPSLREMLAGGPLPIRRAIDIGAQVAEGLAAAHEKGIVHRDLKPENLRFNGDGRLKILDFGLARLVSREASPMGIGSEVPTVDSPTREGVVLGTPGYMAPEQVRGMRADRRADVFALGCVLYEMLSGKRTFPGKTPEDSAAAILREDPSPIPGLPPALWRLIRKCLEKVPEQRFADARDVLLALEAFRSRACAEGLERGTEVASTPSVAVLPFANLSESSEQEYFCDGMAEEIINSLARVRGLRVLARTSAFAFKGKSMDVREVGLSLGVSTLLEGSVRRSGDRLRITAQLIDASDGSQLWSERYDRRLRDVFDIQEEIALAIVGSLRIELLGGEREAIARRATENLEAHSAYLRGQFHWNVFTAEGFARSRECFEEAIRIDPTYAPALSGLGMWYVSQAFWWDYPPDIASREAFALSERALASDRGNWLAHAVRGNLFACFERRWQEAEESLRLGIRFGPSQAQAHFNMAALLTLRQRWEEAAEEARTAIRLDPLSAPNCAWNAGWLDAAGYRDEAAAELEKIMSVAPDHWLPHWTLAVWAAGEGNLDTARSAVEKAVELSGSASMAVALCACVAQTQGNHDRARVLEAELRDRARDGHVSPTTIALVADSKGDVETAVENIRKAAFIRDPILCFYRMVPASLLSGDHAVERELTKFGV